MERKRFCLVGTLRENGEQRVIEDYDNALDVLYAYYKTDTTGFHTSQNDGEDKSECIIFKYSSLEIDVEVTTESGDFIRFETIDNNVEYKR